MGIRDVHVELPAEGRQPLRTIGERLTAAFGLVVRVAMVAWLGRDGHVDPADDSVGLVDAFYRSTVSITRAARLQRADALVEVVSRR